MKPDNQHLDFLISQYVDGCLEGAGKKSVEQQMLNDPAARQLYSEHREVQDLLEGITKKGRVVGFDFVEVAPMYDLAGTTSQVASRLILDLIGFELKERERAE